MNRTIIAGTVIIGVAVMLSMSMMPANADKPENSCVWHKSPSTVVCAKELEAGQHILFKTIPESDHSLNPACHHSVHDETDFWIIQGRHGPTDNDKFDCGQGFKIKKDSVTVRGK